MSYDQEKTHRPHLLWVYTESPADALDAATWLEVTRELRSIGWRVTLAVPGLPGQVGRCSFRGVEVTCIPRPQVYLLKQVAFHVGLLRLIAADWATIDAILFGEMSALWLLPLRFVRGLARRRRPLLVMDSRTLFMSARNSITWKHRLRILYFKLMVGLADRWADGRTAITSRLAAATHIPSRQLWGTWPSGVTQEQFAGAQAARQWPVDGQPVRLIYTGSLHYERNLMPLCQAVSKANSEGMRLALTLVGDGTERAGLEEYAKGSNGEIVVLPPVPHDKVPELLAQAHIGVLPFPDEEKFRVSSPIKLFEYMASGLPILATRVVCHTDVVGSGEYVFWAEDAGMDGLLAPMRLIWAARDRLGTMGCEAAAAAENWTWRASAMKLAEALRRGGLGGHGTHDTAEPLPASEDKHRLESEQTRRQAVRGRGGSN